MFPFSSPFAGRDLGLFSRRRQQGVVAIGGSSVQGEPSGGGGRDAPLGKPVLLAEGLGILRVGTSIVNVCIYIYSHRIVSVLFLMMWMLDP